MSKSVLIAIQKITRDDQVRQLHSKFSYKKDHFFTARSLQSGETSNNFLFCPFCLHIGIKIFL